MGPRHSRQIARCIRVFVVLFAVSTLATLASAQTDSWTGGTGVWSDGTNWDSGAPAGGEDIVIGTASANSTDDFSVNIGALTLTNSADALAIADGVTLTVGNSIINNGNITLGGTANSTVLAIGNSLSLTGKGALLVSNNQNAIGSTDPSNILTNSSTIMGAGAIGNGNLGFVNNGIVNATDPNGLVINVSSAGFNNLGTVETSNGGALLVQGPAGSFLNFNATTGTLTGGTYNASGGLIEFAGGTSGIKTLAAKVETIAGGQLLNSDTSLSALANLTSIVAGGVWTDQINFTAPHQFSVAGALNILPNTIFNIGSLAQIHGTTLSAGQFVFDSNLNITGKAANITINATSLLLSGGTIFNTTTGQSALANMTTNSGTFRLANFASFTTVGNFTNSGSITISKGSGFNIGGSGTIYTQTLRKTIVDGKITGAVNVAGGTLSGAGSVTGNVAIGGTTTTAVLVVGDSGKAGLFKITGTYTQASTGTLLVSIGGTTVGTQYSQLQLTGTGAANLAGPLTATVINAFAPAVGQTFTIVSAKSIAGAFSNSTIAINASEHFAVSYTSKTVVLTVTAGPA
jgi:hypothetical protein